jgi:hypothetical protein
MSQPPSSCARPRTSNQFSALADPLSSTGRSYPERDLTAPTHQRYEPLDMYTKRPTPLPNALDGGYSLRGHSATDTPTCPQQRLITEQNEVSPCDVSGSRLGVQDPTPSVRWCPPSRPQSTEPDNQSLRVPSSQSTTLSISGHDKEGELSVFDKTLISGLPMQTRFLLKTLHRGSLRWVSSR